MHFAVVLFRDLWSRMAFPALRGWKVVWLWGEGRGDPGRDGPGCHSLGGLPVDPARPTAGGLSTLGGVPLSTINKAHIQDVCVAVTWWEV